MPQTPADTPSTVRLRGAPTEEPRGDRRRLAALLAKLRVAPETVRVLPVVLPVALAGAAVTVAAAASFASSDPSAATLAGALALLGAATVAEALPVPIEGITAGRTSLATVFIVSAAAIEGWAAATLIGVLSMAIVEVATRKPLSRVVFNSAVYALAGAAAGATAASVGSSTVAALIAGTMLAAGAFYAVNVGLLSLVVSRASGRRWLALLVAFLTQTAVPLGVMASVAAVLVVVWERSAFAALLLVPSLTAFALYERRMHGALERLRELDRLKDEFIAVVSHELRTPLASVYGAAMTLQRHSLDPTTRDAMLGIVYRESARLARLVDQVLWASRLEAGRADVTVQSVDALRLAEDVVGAARAHLPASAVLEVRGSPDTAVGADVDKVKQVLVNLVENAVKYSPDGGRILVDVQPAGRMVRFTVSDEGLGIPAGELGRIFEKFHRLDPEMTRGVGGTGLGLYICRELVLRMDGRIWVTSDPGQGSAFSFELPRAS
jgi:signal transduction histidine kinase